jgi:hypothetical protein
MKLLHHGKPLQVCPPPVMASRMRASLQGFNLVGTDRRFNVSGELTIYYHYGAFALPERFLARGKLDLWRCQTRESAYNILKLNGNTTMGTAGGIGRGAQNGTMIRDGFR